MKAEYLLRFHDLSSWRFKKKTLHRPSSPPRMIIDILALVQPLHYDPPFSPPLQLIFPHFRICISDFLFFVTRFFFRPSIVLHQSENNCLWVLSRYWNLFCFLSSANAFLICLSHCQARVALNRWGLLHTLQLQETKASLLCLNQRWGFTSVKESKVYFGFHTFSERQLTTLPFWKLI